MSAVRALRRLSTRPVRRLLGTALLLSLFINLLFLVLPLVLILAYDKVVPARSEETLIGLAIAAAGALVLQGLLLVIRSRLLGRLAVILDREIGEPVLQAAMDRAQAAPSSGAAGAGEHLFRLRQFVSSSALTACLDLPWVLIFLVPVWLFHPWLGVIATVGVLLLLLIALAADWLCAGPTRRSNEAASEARRRGDGALESMPTIDAMAMRPAVIEKWQEANRHALIEGYQAHDRAGVMGALTKCVRQAIQLAILLTAVYLVLLDHLSIGIIFASSILASRALAPIDALAAGWRQIGAAMSALQQIDPLLRAPVREPRAITATRLSGALSVEGVTFHPRESRRAILRGVSFSLEPGDMLALSGPSGAGKSALASILIGAVPPTVGEVLLDGIALRHWDRDALGCGIGYLPQDAELLPGTVAENIARFGTATPDAVVEAACRAGAHEMILDLPAGYETEIGTHGPRLSAGQRRRVALARALFGEPSLLVLDEPNAGLDRDGEQTLIGTLRRLKSEGVTIVLVTHRIADRSLFDRVLVLNAGMVTQFGPLERRRPAAELAAVSAREPQPADLRRAGSN
jgi:PrtD family type I secretion system ABC transporter